MDANQRIAELISRKERLLDTKRVRDDMVHKLVQSRARLDVAQRELDQARREVASFQGVSPRNLWTSLLGTKLDAERLAEEDLRAATLAYERVLGQVRSIESDVEGLKYDDRQLAILDADLAEAIRAKEQLIRQTMQAEELNAFDDQVTQMQSVQKELSEAVSAGVAAEQQLQEVVKSLESAASWGRWDMIGGGLLATAVKHSRLDDAKGHAHRAGQACRRFAKELGDVNMHLSSSLEIDGFLKFADYFFDGLFVDWAVQSKISDALRQARAQVQEVNTLITRLRANGNKVSSQIEATLEEKSDYVIRYASAQR